MGKISSLHHVAISTGNMKKQIEFFSDVLGMELVGLFWMHGVEGAWHGFMKMGEEAFAFVFVPGNERVDTVIGQTHSANGGEKSAPGTLQHIALNVDSTEDLLAMRDRIRSRGVPVFGPMDHGMCSSIYFAGPENLVLEISTHDGAEAPLDEKGTWIDQEVVELAGISEEELSRYMSPKTYGNDQGPLPQPNFDATQPNLHYPAEIYQQMLVTPDEVITQLSSVTEPPNPRHR